jgi:hypothetical protein
LPQVNPEEEKKIPKVTTEYGAKAVNPEEEKKIPKVTTEYGAKAVNPEDGNKIPKITTEYGEKAGDPVEEKKKHPETKPLACTLPVNRKEEDKNVPVQCDGGPGNEK